MIAPVHFHLQFPFIPYPFSFSTQNPKYEHLSNLVSLPRLTFSYRTVPKYSQRAPYLKIPNKNYKVELQIQQTNKKKIIIKKEKRHEKT